MANKKLDSEFNILSDEEIKQCTDIQNALELINKENIITELEPIEQKKFVVKKNENIKDITKTELKEKEEIELDEIADQADQAFIDLMDIALNSVGKSVGDISSSAHNFLNIKLNARLAKMDAKFKKLNHELQVKKLEASTKKFEDASDNIMEEDDGIIILDPQ